MELEDGNKKKKQRPYSEYERQLVVQLVQTKIGILENRKTDGVSQKRKAEAWEYIASQFNNSSLVTQRTDVKQLKKMWQNFKAKARDAKTLESQRKRTGGGPAPPEMGSLETQVLSIMPNIMPTINVPVDSDTRSRAYMVLTYPHFLYADLTYRNGVIGLHPVEEDHRIFLDIEPLSGTVIRGFKRAQFNVFTRAIPGIPATQHLRTTLTPVLWIEEGIELPDEYADLLSSQVVSSLGLVNILVPVVVALSCTVLLTGITIIVCLRFKKKTTV